MGNRAHNRRHEGRAIRKARREARERAQRIGAGFAELGRAAWKAGAMFATFAEGVQRFQDGIARFGGLSGLSALPAHNHLSEGVNAAQRLPGLPAAMGYIDEARQARTDRENGSENHG